MMSMEVLEQRREEMMREAELNRLKKVLRADRKGPIASRWASTVAWEVTRSAGLLRKSFGRRTLARTVEAAWTNRGTPMR
jgi:hypothetical protein